MNTYQNYDKNKNLKLTFISIVVFFLTFYATFIHPLDRPDFENYQFLFNTIPNNLIKERTDISLNSVNGFGFYYYVFFVKIFTNSFRFFLGLTAFLSISIKIFLIKKLSRNIYFSTLIYSLLVFPIHELIQIRIGLGTSLLFLAIYFLEKKSYLISSLLFILSFSIHLVTLPLVIGALIIKSILLVIKNKKIPLNYNIFSFLSILSLFFISLIRYLTLSKNLNYYFHFQEVSINIFSIRTLLLLIMAVLGLREFKNFPDTAKNWFCLSIVGLSSYYFFSQNINVASRLMQSVYFTFIIWINYMPYKAYIFLRYILLFVSLIFFYLIAFREFHEKFLTLQVDLALIFN